MRGRRADHRAYRSAGVTFVHFDVNRCLVDPEEAGGVSDIEYLTGFLSDIMMAIGNGDQIHVHCAFASLVTAVLLLSQIPGLDNCTCLPHCWDHF